MDNELKKFVAIVEAGTFTRAAETLRISQPGLSVAMRKLEKRLGVALFERTGRHGLVLTNAGNQLYAACLEHRRIDHDLALQLVALGNEKIPLRIGMIDSVAALMCSQEEPFRMLEASTELSLHVLHSAALRRAVRRSELDLAIVVADDKEDDRLEVAATAIDRLVFVCTPELGQKVRLDIEQGRPVPFLSYVQHSATFAVIQRALSRSHIVVDPLLYSASPDTILAMTQRGWGAAVLPKSLVADAISHGALMEISSHGEPLYIERHLHVVTLKGRKLPPRLAGLAYAMREQLRSYTI
ncbi:hypothetical protein CSA80_00450 [Candidatus Saccharibacteria bacterium]|nr:MAG: hypothetical protein CR973_00730 [Candidatus Saccharibacteria bacterium]PID99227.1 MAG: hypothetical protein CSA80_00450 [Candidatus Saccharibacteria bacterium]